MPPSSSQGNTHALDALYNQVHRSALTYQQVRPIPPLTPVVTLENLNQNWLVVWQHMWGEIARSHEAAAVCKKYVPTSCTTQFCDFIMNDDLYIVDEAVNYTAMAAERLAEAFPDTPRTRRSATSVDFSTIGRYGSWAVLTSASDSYSVPF